MALPSGAVFRLPLSSHLASEVFVSGGNIDLGSEALLFSFLPAGGCFYDVGANVGYYSVYFAPKAGACYAFEPDPRTGALLKMAIFECKNIVHVPLAVSSSSGQATFYQEDNIEVSGLSATTETAVPITVDVITLDLFWQRNPGRVDSVKIDVEGFDLEVLKGSKLLLAANQPLVLTEAKLDAALVALAREMDYSIYAYTRNERKSPVLRKIDNSGPVHAKMLFLVPRRLVGEFDSLAGVKR